RHGEPVRVRALARAREPRPGGLARCRRSGRRDRRVRRPRRRAGRPVQPRRARRGGGEPEAAGAGVQEHRRARQPLDRIQARRHPVEPQRHRCRGDRRIRSRAPAADRARRGGIREPERPAAALRAGTHGASGSRHDSVAVGHGANDRLAVALGVCVATELALSRWMRGRFANPQSAYITGISLALLIKPRVDLLWPFALGGFLAIASKYVLQYRGRHLWNPSNFAIALLVLAAPASVAILSRQWG